jgi:hypothetical protein
MTATPVRRRRDREQATPLTDSPFKAPGSARRRNAEHRATVGRVPAQDDRLVPAKDPDAALLLGKGGVFVDGAIGPGADNAGAGRAPQRTLGFRLLRARVAASCVAAFWGSSHGPAPGAGDLGASF